MSSEDQSRSPDPSRSTSDEEGGDRSPAESPSSDRTDDAGELRIEPSSDFGSDLYRLSNPPAEWSVSEPVVSLKTVSPRRDRPQRSRTSQDFWALMSCNLLVFVTSVCIMVLELTASRLISKHVGDSLYTWTSVIGVVLAGITVGNYLGGWLADRFSHSRLLSWLFLAASVFSFSVLWVDQWVTDWERPASWEWSTWVLMNVTVIFLLPSIALGTISPVVASLALSRSARTGITVGNVYAWGALGSIVGTFLTGFYLINVFGTKAIVGMTSVLLAVMGISVSTGRWVFRMAVIVGWLQFVGIVGLTATADRDSLGRLAAFVGRGVSWGGRHRSERRGSLPGESGGRRSAGMSISWGCRCGCGMTSWGNITTRATIPTSTSVKLWSAERPSST